MSLKIKIKSKLNLQFLGSPSPLLVSSKPLHPGIPLVTGVHLRRPSNFRLTFPNPVAVISNKVSYCLHFVLAQ